MRKSVLLLVLAATVGGCTPFSAPPTADRSGGAEPSKHARVPECSRQFDAEDAGFQTCQAGEAPASE